MHITSDMHIHSRNSYDGHIGLENLIKGVNEKGIVDLVISDLPFDFWSCESVQLSYCHASEILYWDNQWWITHCKTDSDDFDQSKSDTSRGLFTGRLDWPPGVFPRLIQLCENNEMLILKKGKINCHD